jgi:hypothetical protein
MFKKFVLITGLLNLPIGVGVIVPVLIDPNPTTFIPTVCLAAFLWFTGAALVWAAQDLNSRAPLVVWGGLVRLTAVASVAYALTIGTVPDAQVMISGMDLIVALVYILGITKYAGIPFTSLLIGKTR